jgi:hypothetical protein
MRFSRAAGSSVRPLLPTTDGDDERDALALAQPRGDGTQSPGMAAHGPQSPFPTAGQIQIWLCKNRYLPTAALTSKKACNFLVTNVLV